MISHRVLTFLLVLDLQIEFLKEENPSNQSRFGLFLGQQVLQCGMVHVDNDFAAQDIRLNDVGYLGDVSKSYNKGRIYELISMRMM